MTSWSLWTALLGTYNLVSFRFCCCLILFEYDNKCERVCAYSVAFFCAVGKQDRSWPLEKLSARVLLLRDLFDLLPNTSSYCPSQYFLGQRASGLDQPHGAATMLQTLDSGSHAMTCWSLQWDIPMHLGEFSYVSFLHFYGLLHWPWLMFSLFLVSYLFIDTLLYLLFDCCFVCVCVCVF